jgi:hypothetical protein
MSRERDSLSRGGRGNLCALSARAAPTGALWEPARRSVSQAAEVFRQRTGAAGEKELLMFAAHRKKGES